MRKEVMVFPAVVFMLTLAVGSAPASTAMEKALKSLASKQKQTKNQVEPRGNSQPAIAGIEAPSLPARVAPGANSRTAAGTPWAVTATAAVFPADPLGLTATASAEDISIAWINTPPASAQFRLLKSSDGQILLDMCTLAAPATSYQDRTVTPKTLYAYQIVSLDAKGNTLCESKIIQTELLPSLLPGTPEILQSNPEEERVFIKWRAPNRTSHQVAGYTIFRIPEDGGPEVVANPKLVTKSEFYDDKGLIGKRYLYRVAAVDSWGQTGEASTTVTAWARSRSRDALILMSTAYRGFGRTDSGLNADLQFTYFIGTLYSELSPELFSGQTANQSLFLDPISLWLLTLDAKYALALEKQWPISMAAGAKGSILLSAGQQSDTSGSFTFSSKSTFQTLWGTYLVLSRTFGDWGVHGGYMLGPQGNAAYYLSKYMEPENSRHLIFLGMDFPIIRRMNASLEIIYPMNESFQSRQHPFLINSHVDRLFNFDISYIHWDYGWAFLGYFNLRFTVFPGGEK